MHAVYGLGLRELRPTPISDQHYPSGGFETRLMANNPPWSLAAVPSQGSLGNWSILSHACTRALSRFAATRPGKPRPPQCGSAEAIQTACAKCRLPTDNGCVSRSGSAEPAPAQAPAQLKSMCTCTRCPCACVSAACGSNSRSATTLRAARPSGAAGRHCLPLRFQPPAANAVPSPRLRPR